MAPQAKIKGLYIDYDISRRDVKFPRLEFKTGRLLLVLPKSYQNPERLIERHKDWIYIKKRQIDSALKASKKKKLTDRSEKEFKSLVHSIIESRSRDGKLQVNRIFFRRMRSKWGSLSKNKNLTVNTLLRYLPKPLIEYVLYHEMAHLIEKRHNERYWKLISKHYPDYQRREKELFAYWFLVQSKEKDIT